MKVKVIYLPYIFQVLFVSCFTRPRYQVSIYRTIGPLVTIFILLLKKIDFGFRLEPPHYGGSNVYPQTMRAFMVLPMVPMVDQYRSRFYQWYHW